MSAQNNTVRVGSTAELLPISESQVGYLPQPGDVLITVLTERNSVKVTANIPALSNADVGEQHSIVQQIRSVLDREDQLIIFGYGPTGDTGAHHIASVLSPQPVTAIHQVMEGRIRELHTGENGPWHSVPPTPLEYTMHTDQQMFPSRAALIEAHRPHPQPGFTAFTDEEKRQVDASTSPSQQVAMVLKILNEPRNTPLSPVQAAMTAHVVSNPITRDALFIHPHTTTFAHNLLQVYRASPPEHAEALGATTAGVFLGNGSTARCHATIDNAPNTGTHNLMNLLRQFHHHPNAYTAWNHTMETAKQEVETKISAADKQHHQRNKPTPTSTPTPTQSPPTPTL